MTNLTDLERLAKAATPGKRHAERFFREGDTPTTPGRYRIFLLGHSNPRTNSRDCDWTFEDAHFIAACDRETVLKLIAVARAAIKYCGPDGDDASELETALAALGDEP